MPVAAELTANESKVSLQGSGGKTRTLAVPLTPPTVAFTNPACAAASLPAVNLPFSIVPFNCSSDQCCRRLFANEVALRVKEPCAKIHFVAGFEYQFCRHYLYVRRGLASLRCFQQPRLFPSKNFASFSYRCIKCLNR